MWLRVDDAMCNDVCLQLRVTCLQVCVLVFSTSLCTEGTIELVIFGWEVMIVTGTVKVFIEIAVI